MLDPRRFNDYKQYFAEFSVIVKGELDAEYIKVGKLIEEWDKRKSYAQVKAQFDQEKADHEVVVKQFNKERDDYISQMTDWHAKLKLNEQEIINQKEALAAEKSAHIADKSNHESDMKSLRDGLLLRAKELDKRSSELDELQKVLHEREVALSNQQQKVNRAMSTLSELHG